MDKLDTLLQKNPIAIPVRKGLADDTLEVVIQVKRARLAQSVLLGVFIAALLILIAKWLSNDLIYLIKLIFYKYTLIRSQSFLYLEALIESLPKTQLLTVLFAGILWLVWRRFETFILQTRITNARKGFTMKVLKITPRLLVANVLLVVTILGFSGYSYAQKEEQKKLQILKEHINQTGRTELETNSTCGDLSDPYMTNSYEIKKSSNFSAQDAKNAIEAACNIGWAMEFAQKNYFKKGPQLELNMPEPKVGDTSETVSAGQIYKVLGYKDGRLELFNTYGVNRYGGLNNTLSIVLDPTVKIHGLGKEESRQKIELEAGMIVMPITIDTVVIEEVRHERGGIGVGSNTKDSRIIAVVVLPSSPDIKWYDPNLTNSVTRIRTCDGNPEDRCSFTGSIDLFPSGGDEANSINPAFKQNPKSCMTSDFDKSNDPNCRWSKVIAGVLTEINEKSVKIKSSSGRIFTVNFGSDPVGEFNKSRAQNYDNKQIMLGDTIVVNYAEADNKHTTTIENNQIFDADLVIEFSTKSRPAKKY